MLVENVVFLIAGLALLTGGAALLVNGASRLASLLRVSPLVIGLTIVAYGTSTPELVLSVGAALNNESGIALGNVVGSNIFNILGVQGLASLVSASGVAVDPSVVRFDLLVMIAASAACLPIFFTGYAIMRWEGVLFLAYFGAYLAYLYLQEAQREALGVINLAMIAFVLPLTGVTLAIVALRELRKRPDKNLTSRHRGGDG